MTGASPTVHHTNAVQNHRAITLLIGLTAAQTLGHVIIPQAARNVLPDLASNTLEVMKLTALASVVSFAELLYSADMARSVTYNATPIVMAAALYLVIMWPLVRLAGRLEHRIAT